MIIDISSNNSNVVWSKVKPAILGAMLKANEGVGCMDSKFVYNATQCHLLGIDFGAYHFATLNVPDVVTDATAEANYFIASLSNIPETKLPLALDIETNKMNLPPAQVILWAKTFFNVLREAGKTNLMLYSGLAFFESEHFVAADFPNIKIWIAEYNNGAAPKVPVGLPDWYWWQYSDAATVPGITGHVDVSKVNPAHLS